jgi:hypothetical protein
MLPLLRPLWWMKIGASLLRRGGASLLNCPRNKQKLGSSTQRSERTFF